MAKRKITDVVGKIFSFLTILSESITQAKYNQRIVEAECVCGSVKRYYLLNILYGKSKSCGCQRKTNLRHGMAGSSLYLVYNDIKTRCFNHKSTNYRHYGGRGITMCGEWRSDFMIFYEWALESGYAKGLTIDRINNDGGYEPNNCRWVTMKEQCRNRRSSLIIEYKGVKKTASEWVEEYGVPRKIFDNRRRRGWNIERCLTMPTDRTSKEYKIKK